MAQRGHRASQRWSGHTRERLGERAPLPFIASTAAPSPRSIPPAFNPSGDGGGVGAAGRAGPLHLSPRTSVARSLSAGRRRSSPPLRSLRPPRRCSKHPIRPALQVLPPPALRPSDQLFGTSDSPPLRPSLRGSAPAPLRPPASAPRPGGRHPQRPTCCCCNSPPRLHHQTPRHSCSTKMKKKNVSLFELWDKSSKTRKLTSTSTPSPLPVEVENNL